MPELQVINTLNTKADDLRSHIVRLERELEQTKAALSHVLATMHMFQPPRAGEEFPTHYNMAQLFKRREIVSYCTEALQAGPLDTRQLSDWIIDRKEFPNPDRHLKTSVAFRVVQALRLQEKRGGRIQRIGKVSNVVVWKLADHTGQRHHQGALAGQDHE
ncbi:hypothetical protein [Devosia sp. RR2S18]|uniref:hypothetical protein n=1 Tax=Devosia rhizosphaerae TaxID=3049774 RepID=UPI002541C1F0|nr:hypothetical protein [Devosia sp. RR2S18]WIJ24819.1 hypothetical protein QOV41_17690 [Devosia sp. RR2S18]WIJ24833.1 hypothetical protein QOV41_17765 [Devosia sp. RR2S18]